VIQRASAAGVDSFYLPAIDSSTHQAMLELESAYPENCFAMIGLHPCSVKEDYVDELEAVHQLLQKRKFAGIGETGLDFFWDKTFVDQQYIALETQARWAIEFDLPLILHTRDAMQETIEVVRNINDRRLKGIFHCFGGTREQADQIIELGFLLGIGGVLTYKKSGLAEVLSDISLDHIVLETDAPYLSPVPFRGKRNESSYLTHIAAKLAEVKHTDVATVDDITTRNAKRIFRS
jgi:TatD DNase family protein